MARLIDLSHEVFDGLVTYPGLPAPRISDHLSREASREKYRGQAEFHIARIDMVANTGTYIDAPSHRYAEGGDIGQLPLERVAFLRGAVVDLRERSLRVDDVRELDVRGAAVLVRSGWSQHFGRERYGAADHPYISADAAEHLARNGAALVGIDSINVDDVADWSRPVHTLLLRHGIPVVEHLTNLSELGDRPFTFFSVPARVRGVGTFTVRAFAAMS